MKTVFTVSTIGCLLILASTCLATTINVPGNQPTIQAGIAAANSGDTVIVACDTYYEYDIVVKSGVVLRSETGDPDCVVIDAQQSGRVFSGANLDSTTKIEGLTIAGGLAGTGGGMRCDSSSPRIRDCRFSGNESDYEGGALYISNATTTCLIDNCEFLNNVGGYNPDKQGGGALFIKQSICSVQDCVFSENQSRDEGGGVSINNRLMSSWGGQVELSGCEFYNNSAGDDGGGVCSWGCDTVIEDCVFSGNSAFDIGGGVCLYESTPTVQSCTFVSNSTEDVGFLRGAGIYLGDDCIATIANTIVAFGQSAEGITVYTGGGSTSQATLNCCNVYGNEGGDWTGEIAGQYGINGNFSQDPLFCNLPNSDFTIDANSPCASGNHPDGYNCGLIGALEVACHYVPIGSSALIVVTVALVALAAIAIRRRNRNLQLLN